MRCTHAQSMIITRLAGELSASRKLALKQHLDACISCQTYLKEQTRLKEALEAMPAPEFSHSVHDKIMSEIRSQKLQKSHNLHHFMRQIPAAAAIAFSLFLGSLIGIKAYEPADLSLAESTELSEEIFELASFGENSILDEISYGGSYE